MTSKSNIEINKKPYSIGIIGGGQLALMLVEAAQERGIKVCVQTNSFKDPAGLKADEIIKADPLLVKGNRDLINVSEKVIFENEWVQVDKLENLESGDFFIPKLNAIEPLVDRISQKRFIEKLNLPSPKWISVKEYKKLSDSELNNWKLPLMAKAFKGGYDGKGNIKFSQEEEFKNFLDEINSEDWLLEEWVDYEKELALVGSRDKKGKIRLFPIVETYQKNNVCNWVLSPAKTNYEVNIFALNVFSSIVNELGYVGVMGIEFFWGESGLLINEIAPRTHNSGHFSIEGCTSSQFDQQVCISTGIEPPDIKMCSNGSFMINLLGLNKSHPISIKERLDQLSLLKGSHIHWYGKEEETLGRKMGHITFLLEEKIYDERYLKSKNILEKVNRIWPSPQT
tara:strand:- start:317 stop:1507 length:1191 start_codon:yes stop_codon:yes gene_type:complete